MSYYLKRKKVKKTVKFAHALTALTKNIVVKNVTEVFWGVKNIPASRKKMIAI